MPAGHGRRQHWHRHHFFPPCCRPVALQTTLLPFSSTPCPQVTGGDNTDIGTIATVVGGLVGVAILGYLGLNL